MSDALSGTMLPDGNYDRLWWGLPRTVMPCFGTRLMQEGNRLYYLADRAGIKDLFNDADTYRLDQASPLLMKRLELMLISDELNPRHQYTVTLYTKGLACKAGTFGSGGHVYLAVYPTPETKKQITGITFYSGLVSSPRHLSIFHLYVSGKPSV